MTSIKELKLDKQKYRNDPVRYIEIINLLGHKYRELGRYDEAVTEHHDAINTCTKVRNERVAKELEGLSRRALGECYSEMGRHEEALDEQDQYLVLTLQLNNAIEIERAYSTVGRIYLHWALDDISRAHERRAYLLKSEEFFRKASKQGEMLKSTGKLREREYAEVRSRLLINLGLVYENLGDFEQGKMLLEEAIELTKRNHLNKDLYHCQITLSPISEKLNRLEEAKELWTNSLEIAKSLKDKSKQLEAYVGLARALLKMDKVDKARKYLKRAYYLKAEPEEQDKVKQLLRIVTSIRADQHKLCIEQTSATRNLDQLIELCDRLGDNFVEVKCYAMAINYYQQELEFANEACKPDSVLAKIYVSLGQTYLDDEKYGEAIDHFEQETKLIARDPNNNLVEQAVSLMKIADCREAMLYSNELDEMEIERRAELRTDVVNTYRQALALFDIDRLESCWRRRRRNQSANDATSQIDEHWREELKTLMELLTNFKYFLATRGGCGGLESSLADELRHHLSKFNGFKVEEEEEETQTDDGDEVILIEGSANKNEFDLSSDSEAEPEVDDEIPDNFRSRPKRVAKSTTTHRLNQFGETPLHTACIAGNLAQVERLIEQGNAPLNARDNCGWTPLHEAANHGFLEIVECLIRAGADIEACDQRNERIRPLHDACQCGNFAVIRLLLKHNANVVAGNAQGETPVECLMAWRQRTPSDQLIGDDLAECIALENELMDRMKAKGFDLARLNRPTRLKGSATDGATKRYVMRRNLVDDLLYETENSQATAVVLDAPVDVDAPGYGRKEYKSAIAQLRGKKKKDIQLSEQKAALIEEDVVRDDWLIDDLKKTKKSKKRDLLDCEFDSGETKKKKSKSQSSSRSKNRGDEHDEDMHRELLEELQDLDDDFDTFDRSSPTRLTTTIEIVNDEDDFGDEDERHSHNSAESATSSKNNRQPLEAKLEAQKKEEPSVAIGGNQLVTVYFDDEHKSAFAVPVDNEQLDCRWLIEELTRRYFRRYSIKPNLSLVTRSSGAFLSEEDRILSVIDSSRSLMAKIVSWKIETADKRYIELCTTTASLTIDEDIEAMLKYANISATFRLTNMFVASSRQVEAMFQAMVRQTIKELDISFTNTLLQADCYLAFKTLLASLSSLEVLNLSGVGFPRAALVDLLNVSPVLRVLNLSYNSLGDEQCYTLAQMIKFCTKLEIIDLTGCDLTKSTVTNRLFIAAVQNSALHSIVLDFNEIEPEVIEAYRNVFVDRTFLRDL